MWEGIWVSVSFDRFAQVTQSSVCLHILFSKLEFFFLWWYWSLTCLKLWIATSRKELVKAFSPPLQFTFNNKEKTKSFKKGKLVYLRISVGTSTKINKAKKLSSRIFENVPNENCSRLTEKKKNKNRQGKFFFFASDKPENHTTKGKEKNMEQRGERKAWKKKAMAALLVSLCWVLWR